jgi:hypothetical protein
MGTSEVPVTAAPAAPSRAAAPSRLRRGNALALAGAIWLGLVGAYAASAWLLAGPGALFDASTTLGLHPLVRFNVIYATVIAYTASVLVYERAAAARDLAALRDSVASTPEEWTAWRTQLLAPGRSRLAMAAAAGAAFGAALNGFGAHYGKPHPGAWPGHFVWMGGLGMALFALLVPLAYLSIRRARVFSELGARARIDLLDPGPLAPFSRVALRGAVYWLVGSSIASLLMIDADAWEIVLMVNTVTIGVGVVALLLPARGVHRRIRAVKHAELARVRAALSRARGALDQPGAEHPDAARIPAWLAWEARVSAVNEWPFDAPTILRFALFLLVPLGSWLGGALVERLVDAFVP